MAQISIISGNPQGATFVLKGKTIIGRLNTNTIPINDTKSSRQNTLITMEQGKFFVCDLKSRNGTFVNGEIISQKQHLLSGDRIKVGNTVFLYTEDDDPGATADISQIKQEFKASKLSQVSQVKEKPQKAESPLKKGIRDANISIKKKPRYKANISSKKKFFQLDFSQLDTTKKVLVGTGFIFLIIIFFLVSRWLTVAFTS